MNIDPDKENLSYWLSSPEQFSPYLSPLQAHPNSRRDSQQDQLMPFMLEEDQYQNQQINNENMHQKQKTESNIDEESIQYYFGNQQKQQQDLHELQIKDQPSDISSKIQYLSQLSDSIITFISENDQQSEADLIKNGRRYYGANSTLKRIYGILIPKFKKLRKTKEEMTKFCMRKALKFASEPETVTVVNRKKKKNYKEDLKLDRFSIDMPFKKTSIEKTMNSQFLRQIFSQQKFTNCYKLFLSQFDSIIKEDNQGKIKYLSQTIYEHFKKNTVHEIQSIKRLPWTGSILAKTRELAQSLLKFSYSESNPVYLQ